MSTRAYETSVEKHANGNAKRTCRPIIQNMNAKAIKYAYANQKICV